MADVLYAFNKSDTDKITKLIGGASPQAGGSISEPEAASCLIAVATSTITARSGTTLGTGTAQTRWINASNVLQTGDNVSVVNLGSAIANGAYVLLFRVGDKLVAVEVC